MNLTPKISKNLRACNFKLVILASVVIAAFAFAYLVAIPALFRSRAAKAIAELSRRPGPESVHTLTSLLEKQRLDKKVGNESLAAITRPVLSVRGQYLYGRRVVITVEHPFAVEFERTVLDESSEFWINDRVIAHQEHQGSIREGTVTAIDLTKAVTNESNREPPLRMEAIGRFKFRLLHEPQQTWAWPSARSFPWNFIPVRVSVDSTKKAAGAAIYECQIEVPIVLTIVSHDDIKPILLASDNKLDELVKSSFHVSTNTGSTGAIALNNGGRSVGPRIQNPPNIFCDALPFAVAFRVKFREASGTEHVSTQFQWAKRRGESGSITPYDMFDIFQELPPGVHSGEVVLYTDADLGYQVPGIDSLWNGTLSFPVTFVISR